MKWSDYPIVISDCETKKVLCRVDSIQNAMMCSEGMRKKYMLKIETIKDGKRYHIAFANHQRSWM